MSDIFKDMKKALRGKPDEPVNTDQALSLEFEASAGRPHVPDADIKKLVDAAFRHKKAWNGRNVDWTEEAGRAYFRTQIADHAGSLGGDNFAELPTLSIESVLSRYRAKQEVCELAMHQINTSIAPIVKSALENFIEAGQTWCAIREATERTEAKNFGLDLVPSGLLIAGQRLVSRMKARKQSGSYASPAEALPFLKLEAK